MADSNLFEVDSKGLCILCLKAVDSGGDGNDPPNSSYKPSPSTSLNMFLKYLEVNTLEIFKSYTLDACFKSSSSVSLAASLCDDCSSEVNNFQKLYKLWEVTQLQMDRIVQQLNQRMNTGDEESERKMEFRRRFGTGQFIDSDEVNSSVVENIRREMKVKCAHKIGQASLPRVAAQGPFTPPSGGDKESTSDETLDLNVSLDEMVIKVEPLPCQLEEEEGDFINGDVINTTAHSHKSNFELDAATPINEESDVTTEAINHSLFGDPLEVNGTPESGQYDNGKTQSIIIPRATHSTYGKRVRDHLPSSGKRQRLSVGNAGIFSCDIRHGDYTSTDEERIRTSSAPRLVVNDDWDDEMITYVDAKEESLIERRVNEVEQNDGEDNDALEFFEDRHDMMSTRLNDEDVYVDNNEEFQDKRPSGKHAEKNGKQKVIMRLKCPFCEKNLGVNSSSALHAHTVAVHPVNVFGDLLPPSVTNEHVAVALSTLLNSDNHILEYPLPCPVAGCGQSHKLFEMNALEVHYLKFHLNKVVLHLRQQLADEKNDVPSPASSSSAAGGEWESFWRLAEDRLEQARNEIKTLPYPDEATRRRKRDKGVSKISQPDPKTVDKLECNYCGNVYARKSVLDSHVTLEHPIQVFEGLLPPSTTKRMFDAATKLALNDLKLNPHSHPYGTSTPFRCSLCKHGLKTSRLLKIHFVNKHVDSIIAKLTESKNGNDESEDQDSTPRVQQARWKLPSKGQSFSSTRTVPCDFCNGFFDNNEARVDHMLTSHPVHLLKDLLPTSTTSTDVKLAIASLVNSCNQQLSDGSEADANAPHLIKIYQCRFCSTTRPYYGGTFIRYHLARTHLDKVVLKLEENTKMDQLEEGGGPNTPNLNLEAERNDFLQKVEAHLQMVTVPTPAEETGDYNCGFCGRSSFTTFWEREAHLLEEHPFEALANKLPRGTTCDDLDQVLADLVKKGAAKNKKRYWRCPYCPKRLPNGIMKEAGYRLHLIRDHVNGIREELRCRIQDARRQV